MSWATHKDIPASCAKLDVRVIEAELVKQYGNVTGTARALGVPPEDLRKMVCSTRLIDVAFEQVERALDAAYQTLIDALVGDDVPARLKAARIVLTQSAAGKRRGWGAVGYVSTGKPPGPPPKYDVFRYAKSPVRD